MSSIKKGKWQRKRPSGAAPALDPAAPPPTPEQSTALAAQGTPINRGSGTEIALSPAGEDEVQDTAEKLADKGGLDTATASPSVRAKQTVDAIAQENPTPLQATPDANLESWAQGNMEGQTKVASKGPDQRPHPQ